MALSRARSAGGEGTDPDFAFHEGVLIDNDRFKPVEMSKSTFWAIGSLAIGNLKYKTQYGLFLKIQHSEKAALLDFKEAYEFAKSELHSTDDNQDAA